jgi:hypothetical protein
MMARYRCYGLELEADRALPWFFPGTPGAAPDVHITLGAWPEVVRAPGAPRYVSESVADDGAAALVIHDAIVAGAAGTVLEYADGCRFAMSGRGDRLHAVWPAHYTLEDVMTYLSGPVLGYGACRRGRFALHASAVRIGGRAIAFAGDGGAGKSTLAAAVVAAGADAITDDVTVVGADAVCTVPAGYGTIRLWDASVQALYGSGTTPPLLTPNWTKRGVAFAPVPDTPLGVVCVLGDPSAPPAMEPLAPAEAVIALSRLAFAARWMTRAELAASFADAARVGFAVPVVRLHGARRDLAACVAAVRRLASDW